jgi:tetratricopeptide (TPR) repeat protein
VNIDEYDGLNKLIALLKGIIDGRPVIPAMALFVIAFTVYANAQLHSERALELDPGNKDLVVNLAGIYFTTQQFEKAIILFRQLVNTNPDDALTLANLGICYGSIGSYDSSASCLKRSISIDPANKAVYSMLATTYKLSGNVDSAARYNILAGGREQ